MRPPLRKALHGNAREGKAEGIGNSLLRAVDLTRSSARCAAFPGASAQDVTERNPLIAIHSCSPRNEWYGWAQVNRRLQGFGKEGKDPGEVLICSLGKEAEKDALQVNGWLCCPWCLRLWEGVGFWDHGLFHLEKGLLAGDVPHFTRRTRMKGGL